MGSSPTTGTKIAPKFRASEQFLLPDCTHTDGVRIRRHDRICRRNLVAVIQMGVDVGGRSNIAVSEPFLDVLQRNAICVEQAGAAMPKIVEANLFHIVLFEKQIEMLGDEVGLDKSAHGIYINVVQIILAVAVSANLLVDSLFRFEIAKQRFKRSYQRKGSATGFRLGGIFLHHLGFAVDGELNHGVSDTDGFAFKINGIPFQADNLTAA